ncbi:DEAD/DEAH box helicase [Oerskovia sp. M15]
MTSLRPRTPWTRTTPPRRRLPPSSRAPPSRTWVCRRTSSRPSRTSASPSLRHPGARHPALLSGRDITGVAQTGTGKTAAFGLPMLAAIDPNLGRVQGLVLAPTRELAMQVAEAIETFAKHVPGIEVVAVYGGSPYQPQQRALQRGAQIVVGTPAA